MASSRSSLPHAVQGQARNLVPQQLAVLEATRVVWSLVGEEHSENFIVVGGAALLLYGATFRTTDTDVAITPQSMIAFEEAAKKDKRFSCTPGNPWEYTSSTDIQVQVDVLNKSGVGGSHRLRGHTLLDGIPVATLVDLALGKGTAWVERGRPKDYRGFKFAIEEMIQKGMNFRELEEDAQERLDEILEELSTDEGGRSWRGLLTT